MSARRACRRLLRVAAPVSAVAVLAGCGAAREDARAAIPAEVAGDLARRSTSIARTLDRGDGCAAARQARQLRDGVERAIAARRVPAELRSELRRRAARLARSIVCLPRAPTAAGPPPERDHEEDGHDDSEDEESD